MVWGVWKWVNHASEEMPLSCLHASRTAPAAEYRSMAWKDWTELLLDTGVIGSREYRKAWGMIHLRPVPREYFSSDCTALGHCWQSLKAAFRFSKVASFLGVSWGKLGKNWQTVEGNDLMLAMSHGASSVQGGQGRLRSNQGWFGSHLMREEGRNRESKRMELSN